MRTPCPKCKIGFLDGEWQEYNIHVVEPVCFLCGYRPKPTVILKYEPVEAKHVGRPRKELVK